MDMNFGGHDSARYARQWMNLPCLSLSLWAVEEEAEPEQELWTRTAVHATRTAGACRAPRSLAPGRSAGEKPENHTSADNVSGALHLTLTHSILL